jgi:DNA helicase-2/ATP-dependent DNA helicase PcrA
MRRMHGSVRYNPPSRFLDEIPEELAIGHLPSRALHPAVERWYDAPAPRAAAPRRPESTGVRVEYSEAQWEGDEFPPLRKGSRVAHPVFGNGTVQEVIGSGGEAKLHIHFDRAGAKTLKLKYAQLELL